MVCQCKINRSYRSNVKTWQKPMNLTLRSKVNIEWGTWMYVSHLLMVIDLCAKYGRPMSKQHIVISETQKHVKIPIHLTLRSKFKVLPGSWIYATHRLMVIHPCAKYGKPISNQKKLWAGRESAQTDEQTDGQTDRRIYRVILIYPPELR